MIRHILLLTFFISIGFFVKAQKTGGNSIVGTVTIFIKGEKKPLTGTTTDKAGSFTLADIPPGTYPSFISYTLAIRKQFWQKKGSLALTASNLFSEYLTQRTALNGPNFSTHTQRTIAFRSIGINFSWKFGKLEFKKSKEENDNNLNVPAQ